MCAVVHAENNKPVNFLFNAYLSNRAVFSIPINQENLSFLGFGGFPEFILVKSSYINIRVVTVVHHR